jgi:N-acetylneuraminic acid mutarotase
VLVAGGRTLGVDLMGVTEIYDPATNSWSTAASISIARSELTGAESGGRMYAIGGYAGLIPQWVGAVEAYDPATNAWTTRATMPTARSHLALAAVDGKLLAMGGENVNRALDILESFDVATNTWTTKTPSPVVFSRASAAVVNGKVYVFGNGLTLEYDPANEIR